MFKRDVEERTREGTSVKKNEKVEEKKGSVKVFSIFSEPQIWDVGGNVERKSSAEQSGRKAKQVRSLSSVAMAGWLDGLMMGWCRWSHTPPPLST